MLEFVFYAIAILCLIGLGIFALGLPFYLYSIVQDHQKKAQKIERILAAHEAEMAAITQA